MVAHNHSLKHLYPVSEGLRSTDYFTLPWILQFTILAPLMVAQSCSFSDVMSRYQDLAPGFRLRIREVLWESDRKATPDSLVWQNEEQILSHDERFNLIMSCSQACCIWSNVVQRSILPRGLDSRSWPPTLGRVALRRSPFECHDSRDARALQPPQSPNHKKLLGQSVPAYPLFGKARCFFRP